jgi:DNA-3-methyladenine glycosylase II
MDFTKAQTHLKQSDPTLAPIIKQIGVCRFRKTGTYFWSLVRAIVFQQISGAAGTTIFGRLSILLQDSGGFRPSVVVEIPLETLRSVGLSRQKAGYILDLARHFDEGLLAPAKLSRADDETVIQRLIQVKGIGRWTAEMFLMFTLLRPDVLPVDDLGIREAMRRLYNLPERPAPNEMRKIAEPWRPWRTPACWYLWRSLDIKTVETDD